MSNPIKLTVSGKKILFNPCHIDCIYIDDTGGYGSIVCVVGREEPCYVDESLEEIEDLILRDQFAMSAMNGYLASTPLTTRQNISIGSLASDSYDIADAMIEARKEGV